VSCFIPGSPLSHHVSNFTWLSQFFRPYFWQFWGLLLRYFIKCPSVSIFLVFYSQLDKSYRVCEKYHINSKMPFLSYKIRSTHWQLDFSVFPLTVITWLDCSMFVHFSAVKLFFIPFLSMNYTLWKELTTNSPTLRNNMSHPWGEIST
jgi:hypothetical protein